MNSPKFANMAEHWDTISNEDVICFKDYMKTYYGVSYIDFRVSVFVRQTFIDIIIRSLELVPIGLLTIMRNTGIRVVYSSWNELTEWQTVPVDYDSDEFISIVVENLSYSPITPMRIEVVNDLEYLDIMFYDSDYNHVAKLVFDKNTGLVVERELGVINSK